MVEKYTCLSKGIVNTGPVQGQDLGSVVFMDIFLLRIFYDTVILWLELFSRIHVTGNGSFITAD